MGELNLGKVRGKSIKRIDKIGTNDLTDTYQAVLDDNTSAGTFTVTNGRDGADGIFRQTTGQWSVRNATTTSANSFLAVRHIVAPGAVPAVTEPTTLQYATADTAVYTPISSGTQIYSYVFTSLTGDGLRLVDVVGRPIPDFPDIYNHIELVGYGLSTYAVKAIKR